MGIIPDVFGVVLSVISVFSPAQPVAASHVRIPPARIRITPAIITTLTPTKKPLPQLTVTPTQSPHIQPAIDEKNAAIMRAINAYRKSKGLSPVTPDPYTCNFAITRAKEIATDFSHDGFIKRQAAHTLPYPSYSVATENIAYTNDYKQVVPLWINSSGHALNMQRDTPYVCVERFGDYYAYEGWKP